MTVTDAHIGKEVVCITCGGKMEISRDRLRSTSAVPNMYEIRTEVCQVLERRGGKTTMRDLMLAQELLSYAPQLRVQAIGMLHSEGVIALQGPIERDDTAVELISET